VEKFITVGATAAVGSSVTSNDMIIGSSAPDNAFAIADIIGGDFGSLFAIPFDVTEDPTAAVAPTVMNFSTFIFGGNGGGIYEDIWGDAAFDFAGIFSFANVVATDPRIVITDTTLNGALIDLAPGAVVEVGEDGNIAVFDDGLGFVGSSGGDFTLLLTNGISTASNLLNFADPLAISNFDDVTVDIGDEIGAVDLELILDDAALLVGTPIAAGDSANDFNGVLGVIVEDVLDTLTFTGGDGASGLEIRDIDNLPVILASIDTVDTGNLEMDFTASVRNTLAPVGGGEVGSANDGIDFILNGNFDVDITLTTLDTDGPTGDALGVDFNSLFRFNELPTGGALVSTFTIDNFVGENFANASPDNFSILDFSLIDDIENIADLDFNDDGTDLTITQPGNAAFQIILEDVIEADLDVNNLIF
ncbi:MAG: hypothetical protein AAFW01_14280, partial [Pseudomonadota bacterium]